MGSTYTVTEGLYVNDILEQADALQRTLEVPLPGNLGEFKQRLRSIKPPSLILTGMGSSFHALRPLAISFAESGIRALVLETSELLYYWLGLLDSNTLVIAVSQSGRSAEMLRLMELNAGRAAIIAVTNDKSSPLAQNADSVVLIDAGVEATASCKTYTSSLLKLSQIGEELCGGDLSAWWAAAAAIPTYVDRYLADWREHVEDVQHTLQHINHMVLVGRGQSLATTGTGGLIIKEAARFHAEGMSAAAFRHGPLEMVTDKLFVLVFSGDQRSAELNAKLAGDIAAIGGNVGLVSDSSGPSVFRTQPTIDSLRPILEMLPVQIITLALAAREGREAGSFVYVSKVTSVE